MNSTSNEASVKKCLHNQLMNFYKLNLTLPGSSYNNVRSPTKSFVLFCFNKKPYVCFFFKILHNS